MLCTQPLICCIIKKSIFIILKSNILKVKPIDETFDSDTRETSY